MDYIDSDAIKKITGNDIECVEIADMDTDQDDDEGDDEALTLDCSISKLRVSTLQTKSFIPPEN